MFFFKFFLTCRECVSTGAAGARTRRSLGHHLLHPLILRLLVLSAPADFEARALFYRIDCTCRSKFLTHALTCDGFFREEKEVRKKVSFLNTFVEIKGCEENKIIVFRKRSQQVK
jgi:hypothetical protein